MDAETDVDLSSAPEPDQGLSLIEPMDGSKVETPESDGVLIGDKVNDEPVVPTISTIDTIDTIGTMHFPDKPQEDEVAGNTDQVMDTDDPVVDIKVSDGKDGDKVGEEEKEPEEVAEDIIVSKMEAEDITVSKVEAEDITGSKVETEDITLSKVETEGITLSKVETEGIIVSGEEPKNITLSNLDVEDEPMDADAPQDEPVPLSLTKDEPLELEVSKDEPLELSVAKDEPLQLSVAKDGPLELSVSREEPLELEVSKDDEPLELKVSKDDEPLELKVSKDDEPLELKVSKDDEPLELKVTSDQDEPLQLTQDEPLELKVKIPSEAGVMNGNESGFLPLTNGLVNGTIVNGTIVNGNGLETRQEDEEMDTEDLPPLKELTSEELQEKERRIRKLRYQLEQEEMKLVLLRKIRQSQILKENDGRIEGRMDGRIDGRMDGPTRVDGRIDSRSERSPSVHGPSTLHHSSQSSPHTSSVHGTIPGHLPAPPSHSSRSSGHHHSSGTNHLPPPSRHSMAIGGHGHHSSIMSGPPAHSGHHRLDSSHDRHRVRDHGSRSSDPSRISRSGVFNPPVPQIHARAHSGIPSHHGPPPGMTPAHSGHHSSRSSLPSSAVPAPAHGGHVRSTMPGSAVSSSSSSRLPITTPPNVVVGYTPQGAPPPPPSVMKPERGVETASQKLDKAKKSIRVNLEKRLLNLPLPKVPTPEMHFVPNLNQVEFQYYMGLEAVVDILTESPNIGKPPPDPFECYQCATDFTPVWKWQDIPDPRGSGRPAVICESCVTRNIKRAIRNDHTAKIKAAIQAASREEKEVEAKIAAGTYSPPSASPSLERVERLSSVPPPPVVPPNVVAPMAAPSPPSIPSSFVNSNVAHRSSREHRRDHHGHHRDSGSSHGHHGHMRDPIIGSSTGSSTGMIPPPAAHSSGSSFSSSARMSGDELGRRRERSPQVRDTGSSSMSSSAAAAAAAAASAAAVNAAAAQIFAQMQKMTPQQQALFLSQSLGGLGPMTNPQAMLSLAPLLLGQFGLAGLGAPPTGSKSASSSNQITPEQMQQRMFLEMMTNPSIAALSLPPQPGGASGSTSRSSSSHRDSSGYRNH